MDRPAAVISAMIGMATPLPASAAQQWQVIWPWAAMGLSLAVVLYALVRGMHRLGIEVARLQDRDALTGLPLREHALGYAADTIKRPQGDGLRAFAYMLQIDKIAELNETYGPAAVDEAIVAIANIIETHQKGRNSPAYGRWSGSRIIGVERALDDQSAKEQFRDLQEKLARLDIRYGGAPIDCSASIAFGALAGSRGDDVVSGFENLEKCLEEIPRTATGRLIQFEPPIRQKRTFFREQEEELERID